MTCGSRLAVAKIHKTYVLVQSKILLLLKCGSWKVKTVRYNCSLHVRSSGGKRLAKSTNNHHPQSAKLQPLLVPQIVPRIIIFPNMVQKSEIYISLNSGIVTKLVCVKLYRIIPWVVLRFLPLFNLLYFFWLLRFSAGSVSKGYKKKPFIYDLCMYKLNVKK